MPAPTEYLTRLTMLTMLLVGTSNAFGVENQRFRIYIQEDGVYRISYEALEAAGLFGKPASQGLMLENQGRPVALRVAGDDDGQFGPGDNLIFIGKHLRGDNRQYHDYSLVNVYVLSTVSETETLRMTPLPTVREEDLPRPVSNLSRLLHLEHDLLRVPLSGQTGEYGDEPLWYWIQLNHLASKPTRLPIDLAHLDAQAESVFNLQLELRGWSDNASSAALKAPDHVLEIALNGTPITNASWNGREPHRIDIPAVPTSLVREQDNFLELRVPARRYGPDQDAIIDVIYLDWVKVEFRRNSTLPDSQQKLTVSAGESRANLRLLIPDHARPGRFELFDESGFHVSIADSPTGIAAAGAGYRNVSLPPGHHDLWIVPDGDFKSVSRIQLDRPSSLADSTDQRDYFIIAHGSLVEAATPLADFHTRRGLKTEIVNVQDIYDEFNFGIEHPRAIRDFLIQARSNRLAPAPGHVLLVGDANWFSRRQEDSDDVQNVEKGLIPTWILRTRDGPAASDHPFVQLSGDSIAPDMAIGRFPASNPSDVAVMVEKTIAYMTRPPEGPWRSRVLLVSDRGQNLSARNTQLTQRAEAGRLVAHELLSKVDEDAESHQNRLRAAIDEGALVLHFFGHGGRFMWQTAPSRNGRSDNLFDMEDIDRLATNSRLPIILSMSCNTGPFDHPDADSLAEKFVRLEGRGAIAVLAASARNSPSLLFTNALLDGIIHEPTLGEAIMLAKRLRQHPDSALLYNLFGDPALVPARR